MSTEASTSSSNSIAPSSLSRIGASIGSADHKVIGRVYVTVGATATVAGLVAGAIAQIERAGSGVSIVGDRFSQLLGAQWMLLTLVGVLPALLGMALVLVPLQIGATRCATPRLAAFSLWTYVSGLILFALGYLKDGPYGAGYVLAQPVQANSQGASQEQLLHILGLLLVSVATVIAAAIILTTAVLARRRGMAMTNAPLFTWGAVAASVVVVIAGSAHIGGAVMYFADQWLGGVLFRPDTAGTAAVWQHSLFLWQRPEVAAASILAVGALSDVVVTTMRRPLAAHRVALWLLLSSAGCSLLLWAQRTATVDSIFPTNASIVGALWIAPLLLVVGLWLVTLAPSKGHRPKPNVALLGVLGALAVAAIASVFSAVGALSSLTGYTTFGAAHIYATVVALPILAIAAGATMWTSQIFGGRKLASIINAPAMLATVGGIVLTVIAEYLSGIANSPWLIADSSAVSILAIQDPISESTFRSLSALTAVAYVIAALGVVLFVAAFKLAMYGFAKPAKVSRTNGVTLEWAANPQLAYNFETVPPVFGPAPLIGLDDQPATSNELVEATK